MASRVSGNGVQLPKWAWTIFSGAAGMLSVCVVGFMGWLAMTTIDQGKILTRIDAEVQSLRRHIESNLSSGVITGEQPGSDQ